MAFPPQSFSTGNLVTAAILNANLRDNVGTLAGAGSVPTGLIALWSSAVSTIPAGWHHCDGSTGIVDLRDRFVISAGATYAPGATGGAASASALAAHTAHVVGQPAHADHVLSGFDAHASTPKAVTASGSEQFVTDPTHHGQSVTGSGGHTHASADLDSAGTVHGHGSDPITLLPPYSARAYMQKTSSGLSLTTPRTWTTGETPTAAMFNSEIRDNFNYLLAALLTVGTIAIWSGTAASVPLGWQLCDGTNGTPDLRDKFVMGAGSTYAVGATGGVTSVSIPDHTSHTATQAAAHSGSHTVTPPDTHNTTPFTRDSGVWPWINVSTGAGDRADHPNFALNAHAGTHSSFRVDSHTRHDPLTMLPPFFAFCYIQLITVPAPTTPRTWTTGETVQAVELNTYLRDNENAILSAQVPLGLIAIWFNVVASIPSGYSFIPFGDAFVAGAGNGSDGHYVPGQTGGASTATLVPHTNHVVTQPGSHSGHTVTQPTNHHGSDKPTDGGTAITLLGPPFGPAQDYGHAFAVDGHDAHAFTVDPHSAHTTVTTLPPFYALPFMQRTS